MANTPRLFEDLSRVASGAMGTVVGMRDEAEAQLRQRLERVLERMDVVPREEFEAVRAMAAKARDEQEAMADRVARLEARLAALETAGSGAATGAKARSRPAGARTSGARTSGAKKADAKTSGAKTAGRAKAAGRGGSAGKTGSES